MFLKSSRRALSNPAVQKHSQWMYDVTNSLWTRVIKPGPSNPAISFSEKPWFSKIENMNSKSRFFIFHCRNEQSSPSTFQKHILFLCVDFCEKSYNNSKIRFKMYKMHIIVAERWPPSDFNSNDFGSFSPFKISWSWKDVQY